MPDMAVAERFQRGGWRGAIRAARRGLAAWIAPEGSPMDPVPHPDRSVSLGVPSATALPTPMSAVDVSHDDAMAFFRNRHSNYVELAESLRPFLPQDGVLFDVGANIGYFSRVIGDELGFGGEAHLFEPIPHLAELCDHTVDGSNFSSTVHMYGLSDEDAVVDIFVANSGNLGWNTMVAEKRTSGMVPISIDVRRFDDLNLGVVPDVIKIDVEGAEHRVLMGMRESLTKWSPPPAILCEIGWGSNHPDWDAELAAFKMLEDLGYTTVGLDGISVDVNDLTRTTDVLFVPKSNE